MFITPSGLSVLIREFENELGFRLFNRTTRHVALTSSGSEMVTIAQETLQKLDGVAARIGHSAPEGGQSFSLGAPHLIAANIVAPAIGEFRLSNGGFRIELFDERAPILQRMVQEGKLDMALGIFGPVAGIRRVLFLRFPLVVIRPLRDQELKRVSMTWSALKGERIICLQPASPIQQIVDRHLSRTGTVPSRKTAVNLLDTQIAMVEAGEGIAVVPSYSLVASRNRNVVISRLINPVAEVDFSLISYRGVKLPAAANAFTEFLKSFFSRWATHSSIR
jgi:DNA-binding transcriptional LysR family regulator